MSLFLLFRKYYLQKLISVVLDSKFHLKLEGSFEWEALLEDTVSQ